MSKFMERAVALAVTNVREGGQPFGAVIVKNDEIVAEGVNQLHRKHDISAHAELEAIRQLQETLQTQNLSGYTMYASGQPCEMCLTAMYFSGIREIYYAASLEEAVEKGFPESEVMSDADLKEMKQSMIHLPVSEENENPFEV